MPVLKKRKGKYKVVNWSDYNKSLINRCDLSIWFTEDALTNWFEAKPVCMSRGRQKEYSDTAIKTIYTLRQLFNLKLRQAQGFTRSLLLLLQKALVTPDYTTISRRIREVSVDFLPQKHLEKINLILDSTGIKVVGEKEGINYKYKLRQRRTWRKLHIGVTDDGTIVAGQVTGLRDSDISTVSYLLNQVNSEVVQVVGDGVYYKKRMEQYINNYEHTKNARFIGPPGNGQQNYGNRLKIEETFSRYKRIIGNKFKAKVFKGQENEARLSLFILNKMKEIGMPKTIRVA